MVDFEQVERIARQCRVDVALAAHLGEVPHAPEQAVGHARGSARAGGDGARALLVVCDAEDAGRAADDRREVLDVVEVEAVGDAEAVAQGRGDQPGTRGRPDKGERRELEGVHARARPLTHGDRQAAVLHGRVEGLLDRAREAVELVDEEHRARLERREEGRDVGLALERRPRGLDERRLELVCDDLGERGLAEAGWPREEDVVEWLAAGARRLDENPELVAHPALADEVVEPARAERPVELLVSGLGGRGLEALDARGADAALDAHRAALSAPAISSSGVSPIARSSSSSASLAPNPRPTSPLWASARGSSESPLAKTAVTAGSPASVAPSTFSRSSTMIRSAVRLPIPGTAWKRAASPAAIARRSSRGGPPESTASATFGPTACTPTSMRNSARSSSEANPESCIDSSRTTRWVWSNTSSPAAGTWRRVSAETASA